MNTDINLTLMNSLRLSVNVIKKSVFLNRPRHKNGRIMHALSPGIAMSQSELAKQLGIRPQSLTKSLCQLEEAGYIIRKRDDKDRRTVTVEMSEKGKLHHMEIMEDRKKRAGLLFSCLNDEEKKELDRLLNKFIDSYKEYERREKDDPLV